MQIILASSSIYRQGLLSDIGIAVDIYAPNVDESAIIGESPVHTAQLRAFEKARVIADIFPDACVIGADQVCYQGGVLMGKPKCEKEWFARLQNMRGKAHFLTTAVTILSKNHGIKSAFKETTSVIFRSDLTDSELRLYVQNGEARNCAGGYMMEKKGAWMIERIEGDWQNVIGLPIFPLITELKSLGVLNMEGVLI